MLAFRVDILTQRLEESNVELVARYEATVTPKTASEEAAVSGAVVREEEEEILFADRCFAAGDATFANYLEHGDETVAQVGGHKPPCAFATTKCGEKSLDIANMVGCTCSFFSKQEEVKQKKERRKKTKQLDV